MRDHNGLYQGIVVSSNDPENKHRITARVPDVLGQTVSEWARPASIVDSPLKPGDPVWIHWPNGDFRFPVYHVFHNPKWGRISPTPTQLHVLGPGGNSGALLNGDLHAKGTGGYHRVVASDFVVAGGGAGFAAAAASETSLVQLINSMQQQIADLQEQVDFLTGVWG
ncbi:phage baseplate assembly protein V [Streptosporangium sandarakinum]